MTSSSNLLSEIEAFLSETGMGQSYFGKKAVGNTEIVSRLREGRRIWPETAESLRRFISSERAKRIASHAMSDTVTHSPIKAFREERGLTQEQLGAMFSPPFAKSSVHRWEVSGVPLERVKEIERVTGIPRTVLVPEFFDLSDMPKAVGQ